MAELTSNDPHEAHRRCGFVLALLAGCSDDMDELQRQG